MNRNGLPWTVARSNYVPLADSTEEVHEWRVKRAAKQKPSTFKDYCAAHRRCIRCESTGIVLDEIQGGFKLAGSYQGVKLFERCPACEGTGVENRLSYLEKA
jgi:predicted Zn-dependent protease with MMP-like domain